MRALVGTALLQLERNGALHWVHAVVCSKELDTADIVRDGIYRQLSVVVAVGTIIADRPPHRSVRARLRIRLLPRMNSVEALVGIGMQDMRVRNPPIEQWVETVPAHLRALTATD